MERCPTQAVLPFVGLAAENVIRDRYNSLFARERLRISFSGHNTTGKAGHEKCRSHGQRLPLGRIPMTWNSAWRGRSHCSPRPDSSLT
ncbi:MAG: hypothetical protein ACQESR_08195 [Planctomycetota bacterium]